MGPNRETSALFPEGYRASGLLLHITSLPSPCGIGDLGPGAFNWIDRLHDAGQTWWQALPVGPTGYYNSPYQSLSSFVGNELLISPELLRDDGLLEAEDCRGAFSATAVDYDVVIPFKRRLLKKAWASFRAGARGDLRAPYEEFCCLRANWLEDYALFRALKDIFGGAHYLEWPEALVLRQPSALKSARRLLANEIDQVRFSHFLLSRQATHLIDYARAKGVRLIGDLPFFVSPDSSDVWANPELFLLSARRNPRFVAGVPPDYFSAAGQLWGNPVYNWEVHRCTGYSWWIDRLRTLLTRVDVVRLDHFRAFAAAWHVPFGAKTAEAGHWEPGPGAEFFTAVSGGLGGLPFIAEDLGDITPDVFALRDNFRIPGTRVLQFAFDGRAGNPHLPANHVANSVAYTGTHDNATTREWFQGLSDAEKDVLRRFLKQPLDGSRDAAPELIRLVWSSPASLAIAPLQDVLNLGPEGRMNMPGTADRNWRWRATGDMFSAGNFDWLKDLTARSGRLRDGRLPHDRGSTTTRAAA